MILDHLRLERAKSGKQDNSHRVCQAKTHESHDCKTVGDTVIVLATLAVVHSKDKGLLLLFLVEGAPFWAGYCAAASEKSSPTKAKKHWPKKLIHHPKWSFFQGEGCFFSKVMMVGVKKSWLQWFSYSKLAQKLHLGIQLHIIYYGNTCSTLRTCRCCSISAVHTVCSKDAATIDSITDKPYVNTRAWIMAPGDHYLLFNSDWKSINTVMVSSSSTTYVHSMTCIYHKIFDAPSDFINSYQIPLKT